MRVDLVYDSVNFSANEKYLKILYNTNVKVKSVNFNGYLIACYMPEVSKY